MLLLLTSSDWLLQAPYSAKYLREMIWQVLWILIEGKANSDLQDQKKPAGKDDYVKSEMDRNLRKERSEAGQSGPHGKLGFTWVPWGT